MFKPIENYLNGLAKHLAHALYKFEMTGVVISVMYAKNIMYKKNGWVT